VDFQFESHQRMLILRPSKDYLVAYTMFYANEVRPAPRLELSTEFTNKELSMATALIKGYEGRFDPQQFKDLRVDATAVVPACLSS
jgi:non-homologous end joining protein Ku